MISITPENFTNFTHDNTEDLLFRVDRFDYNQYDIFNENLNLIGTLRIAVVPFRILKLKSSSEIKFFMQSVNVISYMNRGEYSKPDNRPLTMNELNSLPKIDITDLLDPINEPFNIFITMGTEKIYSIRSKSTIVKAELLKGRYDYYGNPMFTVEVNTGISYAYADGIAKR